MDPIIFQYIREAFRTLYRKLHWIVGIGALVSFVILAVGMTFEPKF